MSKQREQKNRQPHKKGGEQPHTHQAPSHHGEEQGTHRGAHHGSPHREEPPPREHSETDYPPPGRSPAEELSPDDEGGG
ncbi:MAG TPA: hypothetical protein VHK47_10930 [Polyangia bacterium]|jgi:hypothetical protein|nr:hypothetical protein [Polyangia bacterium]